MGAKDWKSIKDRYEYKAMFFIDPKFELRGEEGQVCVYTAGYVGQHGVLALMFIRRPRTGVELARELLDYPGEIQKNEIQEVRQRLLNEINF